MNLLKPKKQTPTKNQSDGNGWAIIPPELKPFTPEWYLFNYLENWTAEDLDAAIRNDVRPDLSSYSQLILDNTTEFFMNQFKIHRPDLNQRIQSRDGKDWLRAIVKSTMGGLTK